MTLFVVPNIAPIFGREMVKNTSNISATNYMTVLLNRNYVKPELNILLHQVSEDLKQIDSSIVVSYLDANFPFINGFPMFPHLSHNDGKKVDLAFLYYDSLKQQSSNNTPSYFGYGAYTEPKPNEENTALRCENMGYWQYGFLGKILPERNTPNLILDEKRTRHLLLLLSQQATIKKIFIEPYLKMRLSLNSVNKIRFHGCQAVRHDDHIHVQL